MWAREIGQLAGVDVPLQAAEHYYLISESVAGLHPKLPILGFARRMTADTIYEFFQDPASTVWTTVSKKLHEKGWTDEKSNYLGTIIETPPRPSEDRKTWVLGFQWKGPERTKS